MIVVVPVICGVVLLGSLLVYAATKSNRSDVFFRVRYDRIQLVARPRCRFTSITHDDLNLDERIFRPVDVGGGGGGDTGSPRVVYTIDVDIQLFIRPTEVLTDETMRRMFRSFLVDNSDAKTTITYENGSTTVVPWSTLEIVYE